jgi:hypothetical protein
VLLAESRVDLGWTFVLANKTVYRCANADVAYLNDFTVLFATSMKANKEVPSRSFAVRTA